MPKLLKTLLPALALVGALLIGGAHPAAAQSVPGLPTIKQPTSARFDLNGTVAVSGQTLTISGTGATAGSDSRVDLSIGTPAGSSTTSVITKDGKVYSKSGDGSWQVIDIAGVSGMTGIPGLGSLPGAGSLGSGGMPDLAAIGSALHIGPAMPDTVNGSATSRYDADVDVPKLLTAAGQPAPDPQTAAIYQSIQMKISFWVGTSDQYLHKLTLVLTANVPDKTQPISLSLTYNMTFHDFNTVVTITAPPNAVSAPVAVPVISRPPAPPSVPAPPAAPPTGNSSNIGPAPGMPRTGAGASFALLLLPATGLLCLACGVLLRRRAVRG